MAKMTYAEQLKHPNWQRRRLECLEASGWECEDCSTKDVTLHVHHRRYIKGRMAWDYEDFELAVLCEKCHKAEHAQKELLDELVLRFGTAQAVGLIAGFMYANCDLDNHEEDNAKDIDGHSFDLGTFASIASGASWEKMARAARFLIGGASMSPPEEIAIERWEGG